MTKDINTSTSPRTRSKAPLTPEQRARKQQTFLAAYREIGIIKAACEKAGVDRSTYYDWRDHDPDFAAQLPQAKEDAVDSLEYAAYQQAVEGTEEPVVSMGRVVLGSDGKPLTMKRYSPQILALLLKANAPEKYKDKQQVEHSGPGGGPIQAVEVYKVRMPENGRETPKELT